MASWGSSRAKPPAGRGSRTASSDKGGGDKCLEFYTSLADKLEALEQAVQPKWLTLEWVSLAVDFMRSTFSEMMILFEDVQVNDEFWLQEYMVESMKLLDVCNVLKPAVSRFEHFMMCVQLVAPAIHRSPSESQALISALEACESELSELNHPPLKTENLSPTPPLTTTTNHQSTDALLRHASIAIGEKFTDENLIDITRNVLGGIRRSGSGKARERVRERGGTAALALVMRATRDTTDFVASVLIWALKRDPGAHPASTTWQQNLDVFRADNDGSLWAPSFRRLQERLRKELFDMMRRRERGEGGRKQFVFEEVKMVEASVAVVREEVDGKTGATDATDATDATVVVHTRLDEVGKDLSGLLDIIQVRLEKVSSQVNRLFDELVQARKKLLDAAQQRAGTIHRAQTF